MTSNNEESPVDYLTRQSTANHLFKLDNAKKIDYAALSKSPIRQAPKVQQLNIEGLATDYFAKRRDGVWLNKIFPRNFTHHTNSYLGGIPSLNSHAEWPYDNQGLRAFFVGQLDCSQISQLVAGYFPNTGILSFFINQDIESCWQENADKTCYLVYSEAGQNTISTVPDDYPEINDGWPCPLQGKSFGFANTLERRELQPRVWPRVDLQTHKITVLENANGFCSDFKNGNQPDVYAAALNESLTGLISKIEAFALENHPERGQSAKITHNSLPYMLFPKTVTLKPSEQETLQQTYPPGYPWSRLHISRTTRSIISKTLAILTDLRNWYFSDLNDVLTLYERFSCTSDWGYSWVKDPPDLIIDSSHFQSLLEFVEYYHPALLDRFYYWLELEQFYKEATELFEEFIDDPFAEPSEEEKAQFINWLAGWINHGCARGDEQLTELIIEKGYSFGTSQFDLPKFDSIDPNLNFYYFFAEIVNAECFAALIDATLLCISHSAETQNRIPKELLDAFSQDFELRVNFHKCLGYGELIQNAAHLNRDKILLLEVHTDKALFTHFGEGAMQFWINPEDLAAMRFSQAFMTAECVKTAEVANGDLDEPVTGFIELISDVMQ